MVQDAESRMWAKGILLPQTFQKLIPAAAHVTYFWPHHYPKGRRVTSQSSILPHKQDVSHNKGLGQGVALWGG